LRRAPALAVRPAALALVLPVAAAIPAIAPVERVIPPAAAAAAAPAPAAAMVAGPGVPVPAAAAAAAAASTPLVLVPARVLLLLLLLLLRRCTLQARRNTFHPPAVRQRGVLVRVEAPVGRGAVATAQARRREAGAGARHRRGSRACVRYSAALRKRRSPARPGCDTNEGGRADISMVVGR
jgi:hypothetical protein